MNQHGILEVKTENLHLFLQAGFFDGSRSTTAMHSHGYTEFHLVLQGEADFLVGEEEYTLMPGDVLAIPQNIYHSCIRRNEETRTIAFQIKRPLEYVRQIRVSPVIIGEFGNQIKFARQSGVYALVVKYIEILCSGFWDGEKLPATMSKDYGLLINEFFSNQYYQQASLQDLAKEMSLSEKQTERLVKKHTGNTFLQELTKRRIQAANHLIRSTELTMGEIAERVGFKSYSGFWKAYKKQGAQD